MGPWSANVIPPIAPFELLSCTWPFPLLQDGFEPQWQAPLTHLRPIPEWRTSGEHVYWSIDWGELFRGSARFLGTMRQFGVVFRIRVNGAGKLLFTSRGRCVLKAGERSFQGVPDPDGCIEARAGDILDIAVAHGPDEWSWGARIEPAANAGQDLITIHLPRVQARLRQPTGPPLKIFTDARSPIRTVISIYSMILNGYSPSRVYLYGGYQWKPFAKRLLAQFLPFATVVPLVKIREQISEVAPSELADLAKENWLVMKACLTLFCDPKEFCMMDDDLFILKSVAGAQERFSDHDFVFVPEIDNAAHYRPIWNDVFPDVPLARTARLNGALCWLRMRKDRKAAADLMMRGLRKLDGLPKVEAAWSWEQGFYAYLFANDSILELPAELYWYPFFRGLPGGTLGYDYANNPCGFTMIHFGGDVEKPTDGEALQLMPQILGPGAPGQ
jgi:hypothetical protein